MCIKKLSKKKKCTTGLIHNYIGLEEIPLTQFGIKIFLLFLFFNKKYKAQHTNMWYGDVAKRAGRVGLGSCRVNRVCRSNELRVKMSHF